MAESRAVRSLSLLGREYAKHIQDADYSNGADARQAVLAPFGTYLSKTALEPVGHRHGGRGGEVPVGNISVAASQVALSGTGMH
jgi:hypothetical protein